MTNRPRLTFSSPEEDDNNLRQQLGSCIAAWSDLEGFMSFLFADVIKTEPKIAYNIWDSVISFEAKLKCLTSVISVSVKNKQVSLIWPKIFLAIQESSKKRNQIAHSGIIGLVDKGINRVVLVPYLSAGLMDYPTKKRNAKFLTTEDLEKIEDEFRELCSSVFWIKKVINRGRKYSKADRSKIPSLIRKIQTKDSQMPVKKQRRPQSSRQ